MVVAEYKNEVVTIRIHDEYCTKATDECIARLGYIVSESYKRRQLEKEKGYAAAAQIKLGSNFV